VELIVQPDECPRKQALFSTVAMSALCQKRTHALQQHPLNKKEHRADPILDAAPAAGFRSAFSNRLIFFLASDFQTVVFTTEQTGLPEYDSIHVWLGF
jgi:hypothetical protein